MLFHDTINQEIGLYSLANMDPNEVLRILTLSVSFCVIFFIPLFMWCVCSVGALISEFISGEL